MLKFFRKHARGWFMLIFMAIIIFVFVLYFGTDRGAQMANTLAVVDGVVISEADYYNEYTKLTDMVRERYGGAVTADMLKQLDLKKTAYDNVINRQIVVAKANDLKLKITDDELKEFLANMPALQTDGKFDNYKYKQLLRYNKMTPEAFETGQKISLAAAKIESIIREGIKLSDQEVLDLYALQNQNINLNFVQISGADVSGRVKPTGADLEDYLKKNSSAFRIPEQVKVKYLYFDADRFFTGEITPSDIRDYYNRTKDNYKDKDDKPLGLEEATPMIIKEIKKNRGMQNAYAQAKTAHDTIYQEENFDAYATKNNLNIQGTDFFPLNQTPQVFASVKDLAKELTGLEKKDISKVLTADNGYYVIRMEDKKAAYTPALKTIESAVMQTYLKDEQDRIASEDAKAMLARLQKGEPLEKVVAEKGYQIQETGLFPPGNTIPGLGSHPEAMEKLLSLSPGHPYPENPIKLDNAYVIFKLKEISPLDMKDFEAKKEMYRKMAMNLKREETIKAWMEGSKAELIRGKRLKIKKEAKDL